MRKYISLFLRYFCFITTGTLIVTFIGFAITNSDPSLNTMWEILVSAIPATIATLVTYNVKTENFNLPVRMLIHYIFICVIMIGLGYLFGWIPLSPMGILFMCLCVAGVYLFTYIGSYITDKENAKSINKALEEKYKE